MRQRIEAREGIHPDATVRTRRRRPAHTQPTLVLHDRSDSINRFADGVAYSQAITGARLLATQDLGHRHILKDAGVLRELAAFVA